MSVNSQTLRLFGPIAAPSQITGQLPADGGFVSFQHVGYLAWLVSCPLQGVNLVSFFLGKVCVVHLCNFDWLVKKAWILPHPTHLTRITQNCTSFLNSPHSIRTQRSKYVEKHKYPIITASKCDRLIFGSLKVAE